MENRSSLLTDLVAIIAGSMMNHAPAWSAQELDGVGDHVVALVDRIESVSYTVTVLVLSEAIKAEVKVGTCLTSDESSSGQFCVACQRSPKSSDDGTHD